MNSKRKLKISELSISYPKLSKNKEFILISVIGIIISFITIKNVIFSEGYVILHEQLEIYSFDRFIDIFYPTWNEQVQFFPYIDITKTYLYGSLIIIAKIFGLSFKEFEMVLLSFPFFIGFVGAYYLNKRFLSKINNDLDDNLILIISATAAFVYIVNPWFAGNPRNIELRFDFAFIPLILLTFIKVIEESRYRNILYFAFSFSFIVGYRYLFVLLPLFILTILLFILINRNRQQSQMILRLVTATIFIIFLTLGKFLPAVLYNIKAKTVFEIENFTWEMIRRTDFLSLMTTKITNYLGIIFDTTYNDQMHSLFVLITAGAFVYILSSRIRNTFYYLFPIIIYIFYGMLLLEKFNIDYIIQHAPFSEYIGRALRHSRWNIMPSIMMVSIGIGMTIFSISSLSKGRKSLTIIYCFFIILVASLAAWPILTGDMNGYWKPTVIPDDYSIVNDMISEDRYNSHALWMPRFAGRKAIWIEAKTPYEEGAPTGLFDARSSSLTTYYYRFIYFFDYYNPTGPRRTENPLDGYTGINWKNIFEPLDIKYLILHPDVQWTEDDKIQGGYTNEYIKSIIEKLKNNGDEIIYEGKYLTAFKLNNESNYIDIKIPIYVIGGLPVHSSLFSINDIDNNDTVNNYNNIQKMAICYAFDTIKNMECLYNSIYIVAQGNIRELYLLSDEKSLVPLSSFVGRDIKVESAWSYIYGIDATEFQEKLRRKGIENWNWDFDLNKGVIMTDKRDIKIKIPIIIKSPGNYKLFVRYFENIKGGLLKITAENVSIDINTKGDINKFVSKEIGTIYFKNGKYEIEIENKYGFNIINVLNILSEEEYNNIKRNIDQIIDSKTIIYILEAENDLHGKMEKINIGINDRASNGKVLVFNEKGDAWQNIEIIKNQTYNMALKGSGDFMVTMNSENYNFSFNITLDDSNIIYVPFYIEKGIYKFNIKSLENNQTLDNIWLYTDNNNRTIKEILDIKYQMPITYERVDGTLWTAKVNNTKPFMLSFANVYDPLWEAKIYKDNIYIDTVEPIPLYSVINGFWINNTGNLLIEIRFKPQDWFEIGITISAITFIIGIGFLFYDWKQRTK